MCIRDRSYCIGIFVAFLIAQFLWIFYLKNPVIAKSEFFVKKEKKNKKDLPSQACLLYTSDAADERSSVDLGGRRIIKKR